MEWAKTQLPGRLSAGASVVTFCKTGIYAVETEIGHILHVSSFLHEGADESFNNAWT